MWRVDLEDDILAVTSIHLKLTNNPLENFVKQLRVLNINELHWFAFVSAKLNAAWEVASSTDSPDSVVTQLTRCVVTVGQGRESVALWIL